jgi:hypothetical protein
MRTRALIFAIAFACACGDEIEAPPRYPFTFSAHADRNPLGGVLIVVNDRPMGSTDAQGLLRIDLTGPEGAPIQITAVCPAGHRQSDEPQLHNLRRVQSLDPRAQARGLEVSFSCPPEHRTGVVVVRTHDQQAVPVWLDGREVARTDASGAAHVQVAMAPGTTFQVQLDTRHNAQLRPQSPSTSFTIPDNDEVFVLDQRFALEEPRRVRRTRPRAESEQRLPIRIESHD